MFIRFKIGRLRIVDDLFIDLHLLVFSEWVLLRETLEATVQESFPLARFELLLLLLVECFLKLERFQFEFLAQHVDLSGDTGALVASEHNLGSGWLDGQRGTLLLHNHVAAGLFAELLHLF